MIASILWKVISVVGWETSSLLQASAVRYLANCRPSTTRRQSLLRHGIFDVPSCFLGCLERLVGGLSGTLAASAAFAAGSSAANALVPPITAERTNQFFSFVTSSPYCYGTGDVCSARFPKTGRCCGFLSLFPPRPLRSMPMTCRAIALESSCCRRYPGRKRRTDWVSKG